jgi:hypothetical protein
MFLSLAFLVSVWSLFGVVLVSSCMASSIFLGLAPLSSLLGPLLWKFRLVSLHLNHISAFPKVVPSQSPRMAAALLIFCRSWAGYVSVFSMTSPPTHIWTYCMQLGVRENKKVCKSTSPENLSLGPCSISSLKQFHA